MRAPRLPVVSFPLLVPRPDPNGFLYMCVLFIPGFCFPSSCLSCSVSALCLGPRQRPYPPFLLLPPPAPNGMMESSEHDDFPFVRS
ncbi:hypothetical protein LX32DRAFT_258256 [Colletotrichum zoysiae]|uniref:Uncharacterized protein n=1 Tax=Colletotrichum zoysiae TaxID=1216348 RepID=A0AAD9H3H9_9PEZI|nr:hypothetical protein LX32DRAFT_258256 [Colletotrichum zoysiae]